jgi:predicted site-specific integrase-resolvase
MTAPLKDVTVAAAVLGVSVPTVRKYTRSGRPLWPHTRVGSRVFFTDAQLEAIVAQGAVKPLRRAS